MGNDKRKREHPLFDKMPAHVRKLRESAAKNKRNQDRRDFVARLNEGSNKNVH
jgi:hypothetical protein